MIVWSFLIVRFFLTRHHQPISSSKSYRMLLTFLLCNVKDFKVKLLQMLGKLYPGHSIWSLINIVWYLAIKILADLVCCAEWTSSYRIFTVDMPEASKSSFPHCSLTQCFIMLWLPHAWFWNVIVTLLSHFLFYSAFMHKALPLNTISGSSLVVPHIETKIRFKNKNI